MPLMEFEPTISAGERPQTYATDRAVTGTGETKYEWQLKDMKDRQNLNLKNIY